MHLINLRLKGIATQWVANNMSLYELNEIFVSSTNTTLLALYEEAKLFVLHMIRTE